MGMFYRKQEMQKINSILALVKVKSAFKIFAKRLYDASNTMFLKYT